MAVVADEHSGPVGGQLVSGNDGAGRVAMSMVVAPSRQATPTWMRASSGGTL